MRYIIVACVLLAGCATATPIRTGNGQSEYFIECNGTAIPWAKCFEKANQMCSNGYETLEQNSENAGTFGGAQFKHIRVRCK